MNTKKSKPWKRIMKFRNIKKTRIHVKTKQRTTANAYEA